MVRVNAVADPAQMVDLQALGDRTDEEFVRNSMCTPGETAGVPYAELPVSIAIETTSS